MTVQPQDLASTSIIKLVQRFKSKMFLRACSSSDPPLQDSKRKITNRRLPRSDQAHTLSRLLLPKI
jgi:hypothetical protein